MRVWENIAMGYCTREHSFSDIRSLLTGAEMVSLTDFSIVLLPLHTRWCMRERNKRTQKHNCQRTTPRQQNEGTSDQKGEQAWGAPSCCLSSTRTEFIDITGTKHAHEQHHTVNWNAGVSPVTQQTLTLWKRVHPLEKNEWKCDRFIFSSSFLFLLSLSNLSATCFTISQSDTMSKRRAILLFFYLLVIICRENGGTVQVHIFFLWGKENKDTRRWVWETRASCEQRRQ